MTTDERAARLAAIRARWERITPGPWVVWALLDYCVHTAGGRLIASDIDSQFDAAAIAHAPADMAWLIAELERITADLQRCRLEVEDMAENLGLPEDDREPPPLGG